MSQIVRVAVYLRVSTGDQSTESQRREIAEYLRARNWTRVTYYEDTGTGTNGDRENLQALLKDARRRKIDLVLCWKLDRLFRSLRGLILTLQEFTDLGVAFIALKDNIDLTTSSGRLMTHIIGAFAEFEASIIRERVRAGLANAKAKGRTLGRKKTRDDAAILRLRKAGYSFRRIAKELNLSLGSVSASLAVLKTVPPSAIKTSTRTTTRRGAD